MKNDTPIIFLKCNIWFDNDTSMETVTEEIGLFPSSCRDKKDQRKSPFKDDNLEGCWCVRTNEIETFDLEDVTKVLVSIIKPYLKQIKETVIKYNGFVDFLIVPEFYPLEPPALCFDREFLDVVNYLNATIQIDMYVNEDSEQEPT